MNTPEGKEEIERLSAEVARLERIIDIAEQVMGGQQHESLMLEYLDALAEEGL